MKTNSAEVREGDNGDGGIKRGIFQQISTYLLKKARKKYDTQEIAIMTSNWISTI